MCQSLIGTVQLGMKGINRPAMVCQSLIGTVQQDGEGRYVAGPHPCQSLIGTVQPVVFSLCIQVSITHRYGTTTDNSMSFLSFTTISPIFQPFFSKKVGPPLI